MHPSRYRITRIPKPRGGYRQIEEPDAALKAEQRRILKNVLDKLPQSPYAHGFVRGRSVVTNARAHSANKYLLQLDIKDFFTSITSAMIFCALRKHMSEREARKITYLCTFASRLPQGAPTSPALANLVASRLDARLAGLAKRFNAVYTRYADDITFSANNKKYLRVIKEIAIKIINEEGFTVNKKKLRFASPGRRRVVTGLVLGEDGRVRAPRSKRRLLRAMLHHYKTNRPCPPLNKMLGLASWAFAAEQDKFQKFKSEIIKHKTAKPNKP